MQRESIIRQPPQTTSTIPVAVKQSPTQKLEQARRRVHAALRAAADEQPSFALLDDIARSLSAATRDLEELSITVAVMERRT
jgi:hypothetical protein